jgi:hypothetical protein
MGKRALNFCSGTRRRLPLRRCLAYPLPVWVVRLRIVHCPSEQWIGRVVVILFDEFSMGIKIFLFTVASLKLLENIRWLLHWLLHWLLRSCEFGGVVVDATHKMRSDVGRCKYGGKGLTGLHNPHDLQCSREISGHLG